MILLEVCLCVDIVGRNKCRVDGFLGIDAVVVALIPLDAGLVAVAAVLGHDCAGLRHEMAGGGDIIHAVEFVPPCDLLVLLVCIVLKGEGRLLVVVVALQDLVIVGVEVHQLRGTELGLRGLLELAAGREQVRESVEFGQVGLAGELIVIYDADGGLRVLRVVDS